MNMYLITVSWDTEPLRLKNKQQLEAYLGEVCPPHGLAYPSFKWLFEKLNLNSRVKLQNMPHYLVIQRLTKEKR